MILCLWSWLRLALCYKQFELNCFTSTFSNSCMQANEVPPTTHHIAHLHQVHILEAMVDRAAADKAVLQAMVQRLAEQVSDPVYLALLGATASHSTLHTIRTCALLSINWRQPETIAVIITNKQ